jgi:hypothetical protein
MPVLQPKRSPTPAGDETQTVTTKTLYQLPPAMPAEPLHSWTLTPAEAIKLQKELACRVETRTPLGPAHK